MTVCPHKDEEVSKIFQRMQISKERMNWGFGETKMQKGGKKGKILVGL